MVVQVIGKAFQAAGAAIKTGIQVSGAALRNSLSRAILPVARYAPLQAVEQAYGSILHKAVAGVGYAGNMANASLPAIEKLGGATAHQMSATGNLGQIAYNNSVRLFDGHYDPLKQLRVKAKGGKYNAALGYTTS